MSLLTAPSAPGALGDRLDPGVVASYLQQLDQWVRDRRRELDELDAAALAAGQQTPLTADLTLSMVLWKAISDRLLLMRATFNGGRVLEQDRERLSVLLWGRLDSTPGPATSALAVSLPEACRVSDALASQLRVRLALDPAADQFTRRITALRAQLERLRDQCHLEPAVSRARVESAVASLAARTDDVAARVGRGGDVGGLLGPLENDAARLERDLIVGGAQRRELADDLDQTERLRAELAAKGPALAALAAEVVAAVDPAPQYAVPDVLTLGPVPHTPAELATYRARLERVALAMAKVQEAYSGALASRDDLRAQVEAEVVKARGLGLTDVPDIVSAERAAREILARRPVPIFVAREVVDVHRAWVQWWAGEVDQRFIGGRGGPARKEREQA